MVASVTGTNLGTRSVTVQLAAVINPNGSASLVRFRYGLTSNYVSSTAWRELPAGFDASHIVTTLDGLVPGLTYHWRAWAGNGFGIMRGPDQTIAVTAVYPAGDTNGDGLVDQGELDAVLANYWPTSPWRYMTNALGLGETSVTFALPNSTAGAYSVVLSTCLVDWDYLGPATPRYEFADTNAPAWPQRYYRLRWP